MRQTFLIAALGALMGAAAGQSTDPAVRALFELVSIRPNHSGDPGSSWNISPGEMVMRNVTLKQLVQIAYNVRDYSMVGPDWLATERFDVNAKTPPELAATKDPRLRDALFRGGMQALMAERFKLAAHRETRTMPAYALTVARSGLKVHPVESDGSANENTTKGKLTATGFSMERMADWLARRVDRPVVDKTGVAGAFNFRLEYAPEQNSSTTAEGAAPAESAPSIFTAIQEQLGLRLAPQQLPVEIVVVDRLERTPTEN